MLGRGRSAAVTLCECARPVTENVGAFVTIGPAPNISGIDRVFRSFLDEVEVAVGGRAGAGGGLVNIVWGKCMLRRERRLERGGDWEGSLA